MAREQYFVDDGTKVELGTNGGNDVYPASAISLTITEPPQKEGVDPNKVSVKLPRKVALELLDKASAALIGNFASQVTGVRERLIGCGGMAWDVSMENGRCITMGLKPNRGDWLVFIGPKSGESDFHIIHLKSDLSEVIKIAHLAPTGSRLAP